MMKHVTRAYVFKFVGGEPKLKRECLYCGKKKLGGMICVYGNGEEESDITIFVCPKCAVQGCEESKRQWAKLYKAAKKREKAIPTCANGSDCMQPGGCGNPVKIHDSSESRRATT